MIRWRHREVAQPARRIDSLQLALCPAGDPLKIGHELVPEPCFGPPIPKGSDHRHILPHTGVRSHRSLALERPAFHSMTSSARARIDGGTVRPSALAVLRLTTNSNVVGCWTGRSAGLAPLR